MGITSLDSISLRLSTVRFSSVSVLQETLRFQICRKHFRGKMRELYIAPLALMSLPSTHSARKRDADGMKADLKREIPEVHSLNVGKLLKTVGLAAKKEGIKILPYEVVEPVSARGNPLEKVPLTQNDSVGVQGIHLPFHFCCVVVTSGQLREAVDAGEDNVACECI